MKFALLIFILSAPLTVAEAQSKPASKANSENICETLARVGQNHLKKALEQSELDFTTESQCYALVKKTRTTSLPELGAPVGIAGLLARGVGGQDTFNFKAAQVTPSNELTEAVVARQAKQRQIEDLKRQRADAQKKLEAATNAQLADVSYSPPTGKEYFNLNGLRKEAQHVVYIANPDNTGSFLPLKQSLMYEIIKALKVGKKDTYYIVERPNGVQELVTEEQVTQLRPDYKEKPVSGDLGQLNRQKRVKELVEGFDLAKQQGHKLNLEEMQNIEVLARDALHNKRRFDLTKPAESMVHVRVDEKDVFQPENWRLKEIGDRNAELSNLDASLKKADAEFAALAKRVDQLGDVTVAKVPDAIIPPEKKGFLRGLLNGKVWSTVGVLSLMSSYYQLKATTPEGLVYQPDAALRSIPSKTSLCRDAVNQAKKGKPELKNVILSCALSVKAAKLKFEDSTKTTTAVASQPPKKEIVR